MNTCSFPGKARPYHHASCNLLIKLYHCVSVILRTRCSSFVLSTLKGLLNYSLLPRCYPDSASYVKTHTFKKDVVSLISSLNNASIKASCPSL